MNGGHPSQTPESTNCYQHTRHYTNILQSKHTTAPRRNKQHIHTHFARKTLEWKAIIVFLGNPCIHKQHRNTALRAGESTPSQAPLPSVIQTQDQQV